MSDLIQIDNHNDLVILPKETEGGVSLIETPQKRIISADSQIISSFQSCPRKCKYSFRDRIRPSQARQALSKGTLLHNIFEVYYSLIGDCVPPNSKVFNELRENGMEYVGAKGSRESIAEFALACGQFFSVKSPIDPADAMQVLYQCKEYFEYFRFDEWMPVAVEQVGSKVIYEDEHVKFIYNIKVDCVMQRGHTIAAMDHKTSSRRTAPSDMSNQFMGYSYMLGTPHLMVNKIGFQKTLTRSERFERHFFAYPKSRLEEWLENTIDTFFDILNAIDTNRWQMRLTSCDNVFGACDYKAICTTTPDNRDYQIHRHYEIGEEWDVANLLEGEEG